MDLERLPSEKFATNATMLSLGLVAFNLLRLCGQRALAENEHLPPQSQMPVDKPVFRRRLRSVIHDLMYFAARLTRHANRWGLSLWRSNPWRSVWEAVYDAFRQPPPLSAARSGPQSAIDAHGFTWLVYRLYPT